MVERNQPRHVDRRDQGMRRQRRITQWAALGSAALIGVFGWIFAQPSTASAENGGGTTGTSNGTSTGTKPKPKPTATPKPGKGAKNPKSTKAPEATLEPPPAAPEEPEQEAAPDTRSGAS